MLDYVPNMPKAPGKSHEWTRGSANLVQLLSPSICKRASRPLTGRLPRFENKVRNGLWMALLEVMFARGQATISIDHRWPVAIAPYLKYSIIGTIHSIISNKLTDLSEIVLVIEVDCEVILLLLVDNPRCRAPFFPPASHNSNNGSRAAACLSSCKQSRDFLQEVLRIDMHQTSIGVVTAAVPDLCPSTISIP